MPGRDVLFTSPVQPIGGASPDISSWDGPGARLRLMLHFLNHPGLSFLGANLPVRILEYPTWDEFESALDPVPDVLGISFYINETERALAMARKAREMGVKEVWAGNFGAYTEGMEQAFDRVFWGWGEASVAEALGVAPPTPETIVHPEIYGVLGTNLLPRMFFAGTLFTSRSCPYTCNFCQTPSFYGKVKPVPLEEIDRIARIYKERGVAGINILDENFGTFRNHARKVVEILHRHGLRWIALTRVDVLQKNFEHWKSHGMFGVHLGIESLNEGSLEGAVKRIHRSESLDVLERLGRHNMFVQIFYILGFEEDTPASIRSDILRLSECEFDVAQIQVLMPYPRTEQRRSIEERYGIFDHNLSHYNSRNLVWNHPNISPTEMKELQVWAHEVIRTPRRTLRSLAKIGLYHGRSRPSLDGVRLWARQFGSRAGHLHRQHARGLRAARRWAREGWYAHEEVDTPTWGGDLNPDRPSSRVLPVLGVGGD